MSKDKREEPKSLWLLLLWLWYGSGFLFGLSIIALGIYQGSYGLLPVGLFISVLLIVIYRQQRRRIIANLRRKEAEEAGKEPKP